MDAFLSKLSYHATSYAIRSCLALTSTYVIQQGSRLLQTVDDDPLRAELSHLQRRLARKIELVSPILESIEFRYTRGNSALEAVVRTTQEIRNNVDSLGDRLEAATVADGPGNDGRVRTSPTSAAARRAEIQSIIADIKQLIVDIDDSIPLINLWVSAIGGIQAQASAFSPSRLLQASMLVNVGDTQFILDPRRPMQIGPDFTLSLYMLFGAHASSDPGDQYGVEDGQRKPVWQEAIHRARVRLYRVPEECDVPSTVSRLQGNLSHVSYAYQLQIVEDLDDGRVHTSEDNHARPGPYDGVPLAGIREFVPVRQISKMFYADVGRILNINNEEGASSNPVLLLKRDVKASPLHRAQAHDVGQDDRPHLIEAADESSVLSDRTLPEGDSQDEIDHQLSVESGGAKTTRPTPTRTSPETFRSMAAADSWKLPPDLDPEWIALEVFEIDDDDDDDGSDDATDDDENHMQEGDGGEGHSSPPSRPRRLGAPSRPSADTNLVTQLQRMSIASRPSSSSSEVPDSDLKCFSTNESSLLERSPFGAIHTSLSLLEMMLRLASLQEFEQITHLSIPDHVLRFYLDESNSRADADAAPVHHHRGGGNRG
ncbi:Ran-binding-domain-containing protein [Durotheca rogersii]|uniref:Ran-binding-domain-containing protein n=1 Tax=Durotheca rogersii TaxID=419775 RepID=UPI002220E159|nr:Ran-binding-domain-containing protein [Durotheca rogersii]KAI5865933.1 Ran-binding-domain-containing protein [Durotheca rogersii]